MRRIRAAVAETPGAPFVVGDLDLGEPRPDEVLVRMTAAGICHTDLGMRDTWPGGLTPMVFGHEGTGRVEAVGAKVRGVAPGERVCLTFASCGACEQCATGHPAYCLHARSLNFSGGRADGTTPLTRDGTPVHGGFFGQSSFATYAVVRERGVVPVPADLPAEVAAPLGCSGQTGAGTVLNRLRPDPGASLVVTGAGGVGLSAVMAAVAVGCDPVVAVDPVPARRALAVELGAKAALPPGDGLVAALRDLTGGGTHHVVETTGRPEVARQAVAALRPRGELALVGLGGEVTFDVMPLLAKGVRVHGVIEGDSHPGRFLPDLIGLWRRGLFPLETLVTTFPFEEIGSAVRAMEEGGVVKPVLVFD
ncbi:aryl-alcohol dehydrogenase [Streptomyces thermodiastaticus]|uniref:Aryl-alcohol dehydrogenase n=1 Tax=Streptomyces thermodiastaticus TaxID=44061 RepID=A0ABU0KHY3_9ACTN|nr:aryl-alcohol dehydrogenase [Streptomyces thermodiastaticus]UVT12979.1 NAD(P)-dependent alcohol dehydrogenase [Streptomyces thermocarboxydus]WSB44804.1 NAD(P)-dependent alcohol dehydrogenase [Streptomyces cellulosae]WTF23809.1 NAD(P)-dependent alcohol dehydrogenase [Streptomyces cellulosae]